MSFDEFQLWVYKELKINLIAYKSMQLNRRITILMKRLGIRNFDEYVDIIKSNSQEKERFLDYITINVTEFFRNPELFLELKNLLNEKISKGRGTLKIWSAACSNGCEPYTLALILKEINPNIKHKILATDIDKISLKKAINGTYIKSEMRNVPKELEEKYFEKIFDKYYLAENIKKSIVFKKHDLIMGKYGKNYDLIVCRNVTIYFKKEIKREILKKLSESLKIGGILFIGATESIYNYKQYGLEKQSTFIYRKV